MDRILSHIVVKFMNFQVAKMYGNNGTFYNLCTVGTKI